MSDVRPFRLYGGGDRQAIRSSVQRHGEAWATDWFASALPFNFSFVESDNVPATEHGDWHCLHDGDDTVAIRLSAADAKGLATLLLDAPIVFSGNPSPLLADLIDGCLTDLLTRFAGFPDKKTTACSFDLRPFDKAPLAYGRGGCLIRLESPMPTIWVMVGGAMAASWISANATPLANSSPSPVTLSQRECAIGRGRQTIEAILGSATLSVGDLARLDVGDVIRLDSACQEPILVQGIDRTPLLQARLCEKDRHKALLISSHPPSISSYENN